MPAPPRRPTPVEALQVLTGYADPADYTVEECCGSCGQMLPNVDGTLGATK